MSEARLTRAPLRLLILDCDGVLIDSEPPSNRLIAQECRARGLAITDAQAMLRFAGKALPQIAAELELQDRIELPVDWPGRMHRRLIVMLEQEAVLIDGVWEMLDAMRGLALPVRVASNSSHEEMDVKFRRTGLDRLLQGRLHSAQDVARPKPWPDLFLSAAAAEGVDPAACLVVEDSDTGVQAAQAAAMACVVLRARGAHAVTPAADEHAAAVAQIHHLHALRPLVVAAMGSGTAA